MTLRLAPLLTLVSAALACVPVQRPTEAIGASPPRAAVPSPEKPIVFELASLDDRSVSAPAFRGKPAVLAFVVTDSLAGQAEADILATLAATQPDAARYAVVAVEPAERHELIQGFLRFFTDKSHGQLYGALADDDTLHGKGPFGDVRDLTVVVLDASGRVVFRKTGVIHGADIARALASM